MRSSVSHSRTVSGRGYEAGDRLTVRLAPPTPRRATRIDTVANGRRAGAGRVLRSSRPSAATPGHTRGPTSPRAPALFRLTGWLSSKLSSREIVELPSRAESARFVRRGWDSNPRKPCDFSGFQDRRIRPLCHPSGWRIANKHRAIRVPKVYRTITLMPVLTPTPVPPDAARRPHWGTP